MGLSQPSFCGIWLRKIIKWSMLLEILPLIEPHKATKIKSVFEIVPTPVPKID